MDFEKRLAFIMVIFLAFLIALSCSGIFFIKRTGDLLNQNHLMIIELTSSFKNSVGPDVDQSKMPEFKDHLQKVLLSLEAAMKKQQNQMTAYLILVSTLIMLFIFTGIFGRRALISPLKGLLGSLSISTHQLKYASSRALTTSRSLSEISSSQATSIIKVSSSLEKMSSMTNKNAEDATQAKRLIGDLNDAGDQASQSMNELIRAMEQISRSSEETSKIVKTIDEIAFQTNLLSLNSAVEAARAGEVGAGFAVVADAVRSLALQAARAASDTSELIVATVQKINEGMRSLSKTSSSFQEVSGRSKEITQFIEGIAQSSDQYAQGVQQISASIIEMEKVGERNAENATDSASFSEVVSNQAAIMTEILQSLLAIADVQKATPEEVVGIVREASLFLSKAGKKAIAEFQDKNGRWVWKDTYVFVQDYKKKTNLAQPLRPDHVGKSYWDTKDSNGRYFLREGTEAAKSPKGGWVEYWWPKAGEKKPTRKVTYLLRVPNTTYQLGCGVYDDRLSVEDLNRLL